MDNLQQDLERRMEKQANLTYGSLKLNVQNVMQL